ncbi:MAG: SPOR domain-containing protein, partial [Burkholderiaceae bacterium]
MLKLIFSLLLVANGVLFAFQQGYLDALNPSAHEPERMRNQLNADKIKLIALPPAGPAAPADPGLSAAQADARDELAGLKTACVEIGTFTAAEARRFETQLAALAPALKPERVELSEPSSHMVLIPSQGDKAGA